jgi:hypothetical protein
MKYFNPGTDFIIMFEDTSTMLIYKKSLLNFTPVSELLPAAASELQAREVSVVCFEDTETMRASEE